MPTASGQRQHATLAALGEAIRHTRIKRGMSQEALALLANVDRSYIGNIERGENNVAMLTLQKIATALDMTISQLMKQAKL